MKICVVSQTFAPQDEGGAEIFVRRVALELSKLHDVVVLSLGLSGIEGAEPGECETNQPYRLFRIQFRNSYLPTAKKPNVTVLEKAAWHFRNARGAVAAEDLRNFFLGERFDLVYAHNCTKMLPHLFDQADKLGLPICQHLHDYAFICPKTSMFRDGQNCGKQCRQCALLTLRVRSSSRHVSSVIAVSDFVRRRYMDHGVMENADWNVLHNTIMTKSSLDQDLIASRPPPQQVFTFGYLGAIAQEKGIGNLIDAFANLPVSVPARLLIAGRGPKDFVTRLQAKTAALPTGRVEWLGFVRAEEVYAKSDAILVPSLWHEPQSLILIEAATYGLPVFASDRGGSTEVVQQYGIGLCFDPTDISGLTRLMYETASQGAEQWRNALPVRFPELSRLMGTAEESGYFVKLNDILEKTVSRRVSQPTAF